MAVTLPEDLVTDILARLPGKSLMRLKCVQRSWDALFRSRTFVSKHTHTQGPRSGSKEHLMIFHNNLVNCSITLLSGDQDDPLQPPQVQHVELPFADKSSCLRYILSHGPSNGVFCLYGLFQDHRRQLLLWNPATREVKLLPPPPHKPSYDPHHDHYLLYGEYDESTSTYTMCDPLQVLHGVGVDPNTNDFKVVSLLSDPSNTDLDPSAEVYNLSTNSWSVIRDSDTLLSLRGTDISLSNYPALVNGVNHWMIKYLGHGHGHYKDILCFDFRNNQFRKLKPPPVANGSGDVAEVNDSVAYVVNYHLPTRIEIWILDHDGAQVEVEGSWTKKYNIGPLYEQGYIRTLGIWNWNGGAELLIGIIGQSEEHLVVSFNSDAQRVRHFQLAFAESCSQFHTYVESIAPLSV